MRHPLHEKASYMLACEAQPEQLDVSPPTPAEQLKRELALLRLIEEMSLPRMPLKTERASAVLVAPPARRAVA
jgi:hypothetical protein